MRGGKCMAKQLDYTTSIESTQNNGIHGIHFSSRTTFSRLSCLASKQKPGLINISSVDWTTSQLNHSNQQMLYEYSAQNSISGSAMIVGLKMTHPSSEQYTTCIFQMYPVPFATSTVSGEPRCLSSAPRWVCRFSNLSWDEHRRLVVGCTGSDSYWSDDRASHMCIWQDSLDQFSGQPACLAT